MARYLDHDLIEFVIKIGLWIFSSSKYWLFFVDFERGSYCKHKCYKHELITNIKNDIIEVNVNKSQDSIVFTFLLFCIIECVILM